MCPGFSCKLGLVFLALCSTSVLAQTPEPVIARPINESQLVSLEGNTPPAALHAQNDRGPVPDTLLLDHLLLTLKRPPETEARLRQLIDSMHNPDSPEYHHWLTPQQLAARFGLAPQDMETIQDWLVSHGLSINRVYQNGFAIDFSGTAAQIRETFHTEIHNISLPNGELHISNMSDPQIPAALAPVVEGVVSLHDFFPKPHFIRLGSIAYNGATNEWEPRFNVTFGGATLHVVSPYDFATIYHLLPLWQRGFTGKGVTIALVEDSNLADTDDWSSFRGTFGLSNFTQGSFKQIYPSCQDPGQNDDEGEAAIDVEWSSAAAPGANIELSACANSTTTSGLDLAILNLIDYAPPDIISDSYGLCETITGSAEVALENREALLATAEGVTFFIAQGDSGADQCAPVESTPYSTLGINSGDNTASAYAVDVGGTDFMAQYNSDVSGISVSKYWSDTNDPQTKASALSYIPEIPWNDACTSQLIYSDPEIGGSTQSYGRSGFCNSLLGKTYYLNDAAGSGGPSTCFTGRASIPGVVSGTCKGNPKPTWQSGVPGIPTDGLRDQPDLSFFASNGAWGSFYPVCFSDESQGGAPCTANNDAILEGAGGTSFSSPAMAGIQALIDQQFGKQGDANYVYYVLAGEQFNRLGAASCDASRTDGDLPASACIFHDVTRGDIDIPCGRNADGKYYDCFGADKPIIGELSSSDSKGEPAYGANPGYDLATGLGSVDATNLFNAWPGPPVNQQAIAH
jgi:subtilase family serine protease